MRNPTDPRIQRDNKLHDPYGNYALSGGTIAARDADQEIRHGGNVYVVLKTQDGGIIANVATPNGCNLHGAYGIRWIVTPNDREYNAIARQAGINNGESNA